jgi:hypothetical protein
MQEINSVKAHRSEVQQVELINLKSMIVFAGRPGKTRPVFGRSVVFGREDYLVFVCFSDSSEGFLPE